MTNYEQPEVILQRKISYFVRLTMSYFIKFKHIRIKIDFYNVTKYSVYTDDILLETLRAALSIALGVTIQVFQAAFPHDRQRLRT